MAEQGFELQPIISYPYEAESGKNYLMTIDLSYQGKWDSKEEEYPIYCEIDTRPLFSYNPIGEAVVVLHRFGGTYGPAAFLLTALRKSQGDIKITLVNKYGLPIGMLTCEAKVFIRRIDPTPLPIPGLEYSKHLKKTHGESLESLSKQLDRLETLHYENEPQQEEGEREEKELRDIVKDRLHDSINKKADALLRQSKRSDDKKRFVTPSDVRKYIDELKWNWKRIIFRGRKEIDILRDPALLIFLHELLDSPIPIREPDFINWRDNKMAFEIERQLGEVIKGVNSGQKADDRLVESIDLITTVKQKKNCPQSLSLWLEQWLKIRIDSTVRACKLCWETQENLDNWNIEEAKRLLMKLSGIAALTTDQKEAANKLEQRFSTKDQTVKEFGRSLKIIHGGVPDSWDVIKELAKARDFLQEIGKDLSLPPSMVGFLEEALKKAAYSIEVFLDRDVETCQDLPALSECCKKAIEIVPEDAKRIPVEMVEPILESWYKTTALDYKINDIDYQRKLIEKVQSWFPEPLPAIQVWLKQRFPEINEIPTKPRSGIDTAPRP